LRTIISGVPGIGSPLFYKDVRRLQIKVIDQLRQIVRRRVQDQHYTVISKLMEERRRVYPWLESLCTAYCRWDIWYPRTILSFI
jgi:hypothetical protein